MKNRTADEALRLGISEEMLLDLHRKGVIPGVRVTKRIILFDPIAVDAALSRIGDHSLSEL
jgi:hypothetical protein